jgi:HPt (histidine-containing phosphotransfer) domain-containing protein
VPTSDGTSKLPVQRTGSRLPESALAGLRAAFAEEVAERLPRLRAAAAGPDAELLRAALRDVHTLGSSAYVVGADEAARTARAAEAVLTDGGPFEAFVGLIATLDSQVAEWQS